MATYVKTEKQLKAVRRVRLRNTDPQHGCRRTITVTMDATAEEAKRLFENVTKWSSEERGTDGTVFKTIDCSEFETVLEIRDHLDGTVSVVLGVPSAEELLQILIGGD